MSRCTLEGCPYNEDGRCIENQLPDCPNLVDSAAVDTAETEIESAAELAPSTPPHEEVYAGTKLTVEDTPELLRSHPTKVVVLGGMVESGKTTLLARIFEMFQRGPVAGYRCAGCRTPVEFDKLSWYATMESGEPNPTTERTERAENNLFLHLRVRAEDAASSPVDLLLGDIPGEIFPEAVAEESVCRDLCALRRADDLVLLLDGGVLCDVGDRHDHCEKVFDFVSRALQTQQIGMHTTIHLVVSKSDLLSRDGSEEIRNFVVDIQKNFRTAFEGKVARVLDWELAARPVSPFGPTLTEIGNMLSIWIGERADAAALKFPTVKAVSARDFCRFGS